MLSNLVVVVEVLLALDGSERGLGKDVDAGQPLARSGSDVSADHGSKGTSVALREGLGNIRSVSRFDRKI